VSGEGFVDIHCHLIPTIDDGASSWSESLSMARMAASDGVTTIICTPHQLGNYSANDGRQIREAVQQLQRLLDSSAIPLKVLPGADVRIDAELVARVRRGQVLTLGDHGRHVLLELPHELYLPLEPLLSDMRKNGLLGILSHPERNQGVMNQPDVVSRLVNAGCLMQITAGSLFGTFGSQVQRFAEWLLQEGLVHFVATDAHGAKARRPLMRRAFDRTVELVGMDSAVQLFKVNPASVAAGENIPFTQPHGAGRGLRGWFGRRRAG
jgi:protein-tyrosine phosphatase